MHFSGTYRNTYIQRYTISSIKFNHPPFGSPDYFRGQIHFWSDASREYRYGFNGQLKDFEFSDYLSFKQRVEDTRLGRFLSVDPLLNRFPWNSPYVFCENRVIDGVELEGLERVSYNLLQVDGVTFYTYVKNADSSTTTVQTNTLKCTVAAPNITNLPPIINGQYQASITTSGQSSDAGMAIGGLTGPQLANINTVESSTTNTETIGTGYPLNNQFNQRTRSAPIGGSAGPGANVRPLDFTTSVSNIITTRGRVVANNTTKFMIITNGSAASVANAQAVLGTPAIIGNGTAAAPQFPATGLYALHPNVQFQLVSDPTQNLNNDEVMFVQNPTADFVNRTYPNMTVVSPYQNANGSSTPMPATTPVDPLPQNPNPTPPKSMP